VDSCEKLREAANRPWSADLRMGQPAQGLPASPWWIHSHAV